MEKLLIQNGFLHLALGIFIGMPYMRAISKKFEKNKDQWRIAHLSGLITGALMLALATSIANTNLPVFEKELFVYLFVISNWIFMLGLFVSGITGERGLTRKPEKKIGLLIFGLYCLASLLSTFSAILLVRFAFIL